MATSIETAAGGGRVLRALGLKQESGDLDFRMWLVTVPAVAMAVMTGPASTSLTTHDWINRAVTFTALTVLATLYAVPVMTVVQRFTTRGRSSNILLSGWWVAAGAAVGLSGGLMVACVSGGGAAVLMHLIVRQLAFEQ